MYIESIITYLTWPVLIVLSFYFILFAIKKFESKEIQAEMDAKTE